MKKLFLNGNANRCCLLLAATGYGNLLIHQVYGKTSRTWPQDLTDKSQWYKYLVSLITLSIPPLTFFVLIYLLAFCLYCRKFCIERNKRFLAISSRSASTRVNKSLLLHILFLSSLIGLLVASLVHTALYYRNVNIFVDESVDILQQVDHRVSRVQDMIHKELDHTVTNAFDHIETAKSDLYGFIESVDKIQQQLGQGKAHLLRADATVSDSNRRLAVIHNGVSYILNDTRLRHPPAYQIVNFNRPEQLLDYTKFYLDNIISRVADHQHSLNLLKISVHGYVVDYRNRVNDKVAEVKEQAEPTLTTITEYLQTVHSYFGYGTHYTRKMIRTYISVSSITHVLVLVSFILVFLMKLLRMDDRKWLSGTLVCITAISSLLFLTIASFQLISFITLSDMCQAQKNLPIPRVTEYKTLSALRLSENDTPEIDLYQIMDTISHCQDNQTLLDSIPGFSLQDFNISHITGHMEEGLEFFFDKFEIDNVIAEYEAMFDEYVDQVGQVELHSYCEKFRAPIAQHLDMVKPQLKYITTNVTDLVRTVCTVENTMNSIISNISRAEVELSYDADRFVSKARNLMCEIPGGLSFVKDSSEGALHFCKNAMQGMVNTLIESTQCNYLAGYYHNVSSLVCDQGGHSFWIMFLSYLIVLMLQLWLISIPLVRYRFSTKREPLATQRMDNHYYYYRT